MGFFRSDKNSGCYGNLIVPIDLLWEKWKFAIFFCLNGDIWKKNLQKCLLGSPLCLYPRYTKYIGGI